MKKKRCSVCEKSRPISAYYRLSSSRSGYQSSCKACAKMRYQQRYASNPELFRKRQRDWQRRNPERHKQHCRRKREAAKAKKFGLTRNEFLVIRARRDRGGNCPICKQPVEKFVIDHDHVTGRIRGLICERCNFALGDFKDNPELIRRAIEYLQLAQTNEFTQTM